MFLFANLLNAIGMVLSVVITILWWLIIIRALISWVNPDPNNPIVQFLYKVTEPILMPLRRLIGRFIPAHNIGIDLSPILAILALMFIKYFLVNSLFDLASRMR